MTINYKATQPDACDVTVGSLSQPTDPTSSQNRSSSVEPETVDETVKAGQSVVSDYVNIMSNQVHNKNDCGEVGCTPAQRAKGREIFRTRLLKAKASKDKKTYDQESSLAAQCEEVDAEEKHIQDMRTLANEIPVDVKTGTFRRLYLDKEALNAILENGPSTPAEIENMTTEEHLGRGQRKILAWMAELERGRKGAKERYEQKMAALANDNFSERRGKEANPRQGADLEKQGDMEAATPSTTINQQNETEEEEHGTLPKVMFATMTRPLVQLAESVEVEKGRLHELEKDLFPQINAHLEAQSSEPVSTPYTAQILEARIAEIERDIGAVQSAMKRCKRLEEREAKLARVGLAPPDQVLLDAQAAEQERCKIEAEKRHGVKVEALIRIEKLKKEEQARREVRGTKQTARESDRGLISYLRGNDWDIAAAQNVLKIRWAMLEPEKELDRLEARVARRNRQMVDAYSSDSTQDLRKGDGWSANEVRAKLEENQRLRLMIYRQFKEYMEANGTAAAKSLLRALSKVPECTSSQLRLKNALVNAIQQHHADSGSKDECPESGGVSALAPTHVAQTGLPTHHMPHYSTNPFTSGTTDGTFFSPTQRSQGMENMQESPSVYLVPEFSEQPNGMPSFTSGPQSNGMPHPDFLRRIDSRPSVSASVQTRYAESARRLSAVNGRKRVKVEDKKGEEIIQKAKILSSTYDPEWEDHEVYTPTNEADQGKAITSEEKETVTQKAEFIEALPSDRFDPGAFVRDPDLGVHEVDGPLNEIDQEEPFTGDQLDEPIEHNSSQAQLPHPDVIHSTSSVIILVILSYISLWCYTYWKLSGQIYLAPASVFVGFRVSKDLLDLYRRKDHFWMSGDPQSIALGLTSINMIKYVSTIHLTTWYGPCCALCTVWLVPFAMELLGWCSNGRISFERCFPSRIRPMQGPFPEKTSDHCGIFALASFGINTSRISLSILRARLVDVIYYALTYVALFSRRETCVTKAMALIISIFLHSGLCPQPRLPEEADTMFHLRQREFDFTRTSGRILRPSLTECFAQQRAALERGLTKYENPICFAVVMTMFWTIIPIFIFAL